MDETNIPKEYYMAQTICNKCKKANPPQAKFCGGCGSSLSQKRPAIAEADIEALFESSFSEPPPSNKKNFDHGASDLFQTIDTPSNHSENLGKIFDSTGDDSSIESIFDDYVPGAAHESAIQSGNDNSSLSSLSLREKEQDGLVKEAFDSLMEDKKNDYMVNADLDSSSPSAGLLEQDILAAAKEELLLSSTTTSFLDNFSSKGSKKSTDEDSSPIGEVDNETDNEPGDEADDEADDDDNLSTNVTPETRSSRKKKESKKKPKSKTLAEMASRTKYLSKPTFVSSVAGAGSFLIVSLLFSFLLFPLIPAKLPAEAPFAGPVLTLSFAFGLKKIFKAKLWPFAILNIVMLAISFIGAFLFADKLTLPKGLAPELLQSIVMTLTLVAGIYGVINSKLLHRVFRYVLLTIGVYSLMGLLKGIAAGLSYEHTIELRQLVAQGNTSIISELATLFEPTFVGVNLFLPLVAIILLFESMRLIMNKFFKESFPGLLLLVYIGGALFINIGIYERNNIPNLKRMIITKQVFPGQSSESSSSAAPDSTSGNSRVTTPAPTTKPADVTPPPATTPANTSSDETSSDNGADDDFGF
jgi:ribosomal protein L40E